MGKTETSDFLTHLAVHNHVAASTQKQALSALLFLSKKCCTNRSNGTTKYDIRTVQELRGHQNVETTMIYTHVVQKGARAVRSPSDDLQAVAPAFRDNRITLVI